MTTQRFLSVLRPLTRRRVYPLLLAMLFVLTSSPSLGQVAQEKAPKTSRDLARVDPAEVGMSAEGLEKLNGAMHELVDGGQLAGVATAVARHGKVVNWDVYGMQDVEAQLPLKDDTIFRIYSMTKPIAGAALMTLYEEGKFTLDDPVEKFIPQFKNLKVAAEDGPDGQPVVEEPHHKMTIRELMSHTGGFTYGSFSQSQVDTLYQKVDILDKNSTLEEMVEKLSKIPLRQQPGTLWHYSVSVDVQGYLVEVLTGKPFDQVLRERIFEPLEMRDTGFYVPKEKSSRLSKIYGPSNGPPPEICADDFLEPPKLFSGGGGLTSTLNDYLRFSQMLLNGGELDGVRILKPETVALMRTNQLPEGMERMGSFGGRANAFGLDFAIVVEPSAGADHPLAKSEYWWFGIGGTWFGINPTQDLVIVGMVQSCGGRGAFAARSTSKRLAYEAILDPVLQAVP